MVKLYTEKLFFVAIFLGLTFSLASAQNAEVVAFEAIGSHTWTVPDQVREVDVLVVGGGGAGGGDDTGTSGPGGGGGGGIVFQDNFSVSPGDEITVTVGDGGSGDYRNGEQGESSSFGSLTAYGGGGGAYAKAGTNAPTPSPRGGGGGGADRGSGASSTTQGNVGGDGYENSNGENGGSGGEKAGGGGGGSKNGDGGDGGNGVYFGDIFGEEYGDTGYFAGGGGGGTDDGGQSSGGLGGGGYGENGCANGQNGVDGTGGGGGGGGSDCSSGRGGDGGSGIVLIRYDSGPSICDRRGPFNECISNSSHSVSGQFFNITSVFEAEKSSFFSALSGMATIQVGNSSFVSGVWEGSFNISTPGSQRNVLKPGADFRPEDGRIIIN